MNPNRFVDAASITSQTDRPSRRHVLQSSFTSATFTLRKMFSKSLTISAVWVLETATTRPMICRYSTLASSRQVSVTPPTTLGIFDRVQVALPGSIRSGENARKNCAPTAIPRPTKRLSRTSSVVPG
jgi:hypothetical protein